MKINEIKQKSVVGAKWTVILSIIALPLSYITSIILGRVSPDALGTIGLINVFTLSVISFILFGGNNVILKYLPEINDNKKFQFIFTYSLLILIFSVSFIIIIFFYPQILNFIIGPNLQSEYIYYLIIFIPLIILFNLSNYVLNGLLEIKLSSIISQLFAYGSFIIFLTFWIAYPNIFQEEYILIIFGTYSVLYFVLGIISASFAINKLLEKNSRAKDDLTHKKNYNIIKAIRNNIHIPKNFWISATFIHLSTILYFISDKLDQIIIINLFGLTELGFYYAALQMAMFIRFLPLLIGNIVLPTFSNFLVHDEINSIKQWYVTITRYNALITIPIVLFLIFFSKYIMSIFGEIYVNNYYFLVILAGFFFSGILSPLNNSVIIAKGKTKLYFFAEFFSTIIGFIIILLLVEKLGIISLAIYRGFTILLWQIITQIIVKNIGFSLKIDIAYEAGLLISFLAMILYLIFPITILWINILIFIIFLVVFLYISKYSKEDIYSLLNILGLIKKEI